MKYKVECILLEAKIRAKARWQLSPELTKSIPPTSILRRRCNRHNRTSNHAAYLN
jgi:hypothetical protein